MNNLHVTRIATADGVPISVIILTQEKNELLEKCIESARFAAEVIVVELVTKPIENFAAVRNDAVSYAKHDWVFFIDSDEVVEGSLDFSQKRIFLAKQVEDPTISGITIQRKDIFLGKQLNWGEVGSVRILRMFRKSRAKYQRAVHEHVTFTNQASSKIVSSEVVLLHYSHTSISSFWQKVTRYAVIEKELRLDGQKAPSAELWLILQLLFYPPGKFFYNYILRLGFLDGWRGVVYATMMSVHSFAVRALLYESKQKS